MGVRAISYTTAKCLAMEDETTYSIVHNNYNYNFELRTYEDFSDFVSQNLLTYFDFTNTKWRLNEQGKSTDKYTMAKCLSATLQMMFCVAHLPLSVIPVTTTEEKDITKRPYEICIRYTPERDKHNTPALCTIFFETTDCDIPKRQSNSSGKGKLITGIQMTGYTNIKDMLESKGVFNIVDYTVHLDYIICNMHYKLNDLSEANDEALTDGSDLYGQYDASPFIKQVCSISEDLADFSLDLILTTKKYKNNTKNINPKQFDVER